MGKFSCDVVCFAERLVSGHPVSHHVLKCQMLLQTSSGASWRGGDARWAVMRGEVGQSHHWGVSALEPAVHLCSSRLEQDVGQGFGQALVFGDKCGTTGWQERQFWGNCLTDVQRYLRQTRKTAFPWATRASFSHTDWDIETCHLIW